MSVTIYHNPRCNTSRKTLALLRDKGIEPEIVEYLKTPYTAAQLKHLLGQLKMPTSVLVRKKEAAAAGIDPKTLPEEELIAAMVENPILVERPIVVSGGKAALGRPPADVLPAVTDDDVRRAAREELCGYWARASRRPAMTSSRG